jgi:hypothetical protein
MAYSVTVLGNNLAFLLNQAFKDLYINKSSTLASLFPSHLSDISALLKAQG